MPHGLWWSGARGGQVAPIPLPPTQSMTETAPKPSAKTAAGIAPAGLVFLAITSIGWGFNWPVTKYLLSQLPPLTLRGSTGVVGALLLALLAILRGQSLRVPPEMW